MSSKGPNKPPATRKMISASAMLSSESDTDINIWKLREMAGELKLLQPIKDSVDCLREAIEKIAVRVGEAEARISELEDTTATQNTAISALQKSNAELILKIDQLEGNSRRSNLRILGIPVNSEQEFLESSKMGKGDPKKPRGKMSSYAYFVQTCREEHKKKHPDASVNFSEFSKKCSERWKTMSAKEKGKFEDMARADKVRYEREMKNYIPPKGESKKKFKDPNAPKRPPSAFFLFCSEYRPKIKGESPGLSIGDVAKKLGEMWNNTSADDKQPFEKKAAKLKEKYEKDIAAYRAKGKPEVAKKVVPKPEKSKKKEEEDEDDEDDDEEEDEEEEEEDEDEEDDDE